MGHYIISLDSRSALQETSTGGKGASLARLRRAGFLAPAGFVISAAAFRDVMQACGIEARLHGRDWTQSDLDRVREQVTSCHIPDGLARAITRAYQALGGRVAVRSSMVGEDTLVASFAGQLDTVLDVRGETEVLEATKRCWASVFNWRLFRYLSERQAVLPGAVLERAAVAVVVQRVVDARAAGVAFSADPVTGQRCVVIEAAPGPGDAVVRGRVEPDRYVVDARNVLAEAMPAEAGLPVLEEEQVLLLAQTVRRVASRMREPQDIEWAWDGADFHLLQSRPITSLAGKTVYSNKMVSDMVPGLIKPLVWSTNTVSMARNVFGRILTQLLGPSDTDYGLLIARIRSRAYGNMSLWGEVFERLGLPANFFEMLGRDERAESRRPRITSQLVRTMLRLLVFAWRHSRVADEIAAFVERRHQELEPYRGATWSAQSPQELLASYVRLAALHRETQWYIFLGPANMMVRNRLLNRLVQSRAPDVQPSDLIRGLAGLKALEPNEELYELATQAGALDDETRQLLVRGDNDAIRAALSRTDDGRALVGGVDAFLRRYGFVSTSGTDFAGTPWIEDPTVIWHAIGRAASSPMEPASEDVGAIREQARRRVRSQLNWPQRLLFDRLLHSTASLIELREQTSLLMSEDAFHMRRIFLAIADHLVDRGDLEQRDDIFYLSYAECRQVVEGELAGSAAQERVRSRRAEMEADATIELPETICGEVVPTTPIRPAEDLEYLVGISGSSGVADGRAHIVLEPSQAPVTLSKNDILVVPFTDVGWTPLLSGIGGIVAETGGQLSHTAIVAREYGLPAVVSVKKATRLIREGRRVTVDGDRGRVYLS